MNSARRFILALILSIGASAAASAADRPNIVFVLIDDLRWDALGAEGHPYVRTPHIDRVAREGLRFERAFVATPLCSPARGTFLTGQYGSTNGVVDNRDHSALSHRLPTFAPPLRAAGYATAYLGKWHMGNDDSPRPGWDHWVSFRGQGSHTDPELNFNGERRKVTGYMADLLSDYAVDFVRRPHDRPFFLYLSHKAVHGPYIPPERHKDAYADRPIAQNPAYFDDLKGKPAVTPNLNPGLTANMTADDFSPQARNQLRMITAVDEGLGRILQALSETGRLDRTLVIFTSDNGYAWGEHGRRGKRVPYEESIRVPLYLRWPAGIAAATARSHLVNSIDLAPTFLELAGAPVPATIQGRSLVPLFRSPDAPWRDAIFLEYSSYGETPDVPTWRGVRTERWKYVRYPDRPGQEELYDLRADPWELTNLAKHPDLRDTVARLASELDRFPSAPR